VYTYVYTYIGWKEKETPRRRLKPARSSSEEEKEVCEAYIQREREKEREKEREEVRVFGILHNMSRQLRQYLYFCEQAAASVFVLLYWSLELYPTCIKALSFDTDSYEGGGQIYSA
jgi:hypothetical protein